MATKRHSEERRWTLKAAMYAGFISTFLAFLETPNAGAQALLYDNTDHLWSLPHTGPRNIIWVGPEQRDWIDAQPFKLGEHDNVASLSIPIARDLGSVAAGTIRFSIWDDNGRGFPGQEVGELGVLDIDSLPRFDFPGNQGGPRPSVVANQFPLVTFDSRIDDLVPGETYYVFIDYRDLDRTPFGDVLVGLGNDVAGTNRTGTSLIKKNEDRDWEPGSLGSHHFLQMSVTTSDEPYTTIVCPVGTIYHQDFTMGDGRSGDHVHASGLGILG